MKKKAFNYIIFTLAFFSLFFSGKVFASNTVTISGNTAILDFTGHTYSFCIVPFADSLNSCTNALSGSNVSAQTNTYNFDLTQVNGNNPHISGEYKFNFFNSGVYAETSLPIFATDEVWNTDEFQATTTRIISQNLPIGGTITPTTSVTFNFTYFANGGGLNGAAKALSLKTGFDFSTGQMVPANMLLGWGPVTLYKAGKKLPAFANKILSRI